MAEHRMNRPRGSLTLLSRRNLVILTTASLLVLAGAVVTACLIGWPVAVLVGGIGAANVTTEWLWARDHALDTRERDRQWGRLEQEWAQLREDQTSARTEARKAVDLLASKPGGAPLVADVTAHCGCDHRWMFDSRHGWQLIEITRTGPDCTVLARTPQGATA